MQWFKNAQIFKVDTTISSEKLEEALAQKQFHPCGDYDLKTIGWVAPLKGTGLTFEANGCILLRLRLQEKILPATVVRDFVNEKIAEIETAELRNVRRKERVEIKGQVIDELLPRALPKNTDVALYLDVKNQWLVIDLPSRNKAEEVCSFLRATMGSLTAVSPEFDNEPSATMTRWLKSHEVPQPFTLDSDCKLVASEGESVTCKQMDLLSTEVQEHLNTGKMVEYLALTWGGKIEFVLDGDFGIKRIKFAEIEQGQDDDEYSDLMLMASELKGLFGSLFDALGDTVA